MIGTLEQLPQQIWETAGALAGALFILNAPSLQSKALTHIDTGASRPSATYGRRQQGQRDAHDQFH